MCNWNRWARLSISLLNIEKSKINRSHLTGSNTYLFYMKFIATDGKVKRNLHETWLNFLSFFFLILLENICLRQQAMRGYYPDYLQLLTPIIQQIQAPQSKSAVFFSVFIFHKKYGQRSILPKSLWNINREIFQIWFWFFAYSAIVCMLSSVRLLAPGWTIAHQTPLSMGCSRQEYWSGLPFPHPGHLPETGIEPTSPVCSVIKVLQKGFCSYS